MSTTTLDEQIAQMKNNMLEKDAFGNLPNHLVISVTTLKDLLAIIAVVDEFNEYYSNILKLDKKDELGMHRFIDGFLYRAKKLFYSRNESLT